MSGIVAIIGEDAGRVDGQSLLRAVSLVESCRGRFIETETARFAGAYPQVLPGNTARVFESDAFVGLLCGDPVTDRPFDWADVLATVFGQDRNAFDLGELHGAFALVAYEKATGRIRAVTDAFGIQPLYAARFPKVRIVASTFAPFLRFGDPAPGANTRWVQEYLFFNYPVLSQTPVEGVERLPPGCIHAIDSVDGGANATQYVPLIERSASSSGRADEAAETVALFRSVVPKWIESDAPVAMSLSRGLDSRAVLAALPASSPDKVSTFTYGIPDSSEILEARHLAERLGYRHQELFLADEYLAQLPTLMHETVYLSDAQQVINRSNLPLVYAAVRNDGRPVGSILSGVSGDHVFRDHISAWGNVPYLISADVAAMHRTGRRSIDDGLYESMFGPAWSAAGEYLRTVLDEIETVYGPFGDPQAYYRYLMYVAGSRYFGGQAAIANRFTHFRTPYWDRRLVQFGMDARLGTVGQSQLNAARKDKYLETILQASVVAAHPVLRDIPYMNLPVTVFTRRTRLPYEIARVARKATTILTGRKRVDEEDWHGWYRTVLRDEIDELMGDDCRVADHVTREFIDRQREAVDIHWLGKLITVEITLRLVENGWARTAPYPP